MGRRMPFGVYPPWKMKSPMAVRLFGRDRIARMRVDTTVADMGSFPLFDVKVNNHP